MPDISRILFIRADGIGDALNSTPAIRWVHQCYPGAEITCVLTELGEPMLRGNPDVTQIWVHRRGASVGRLRFLRQLRGESFDMAIALQTSSWCHFLALASGARHRIGRYEKRFRAWLTHPDQTVYGKGTIHEIDRNLNLVRPVCVGEPSRELVLNLTDEELEQARSQLHQLSLASDQPWLLIHPGGSSEDKRWPAASFAEIARRLRSLSIPTLVVHGPGEQEIAHAIAASADVIVLQPPSLRALAGVIRQAPLLLCNDSGPMHIASALGTPVVALFGPTDHIRWRPENGSVVRQEMKCWPCSAHLCQIGHSCIKQLSIEEVWHEVKRLADQ